MWVEWNILDLSSKTRGVNGHSGAHLKWTFFKTPFITLTTECFTSSEKRMSKLVLKYTVQPGKKKVIPYNFVFLWKETFDIIIQNKNHCRWWPQPWNLKRLAPWKKSYDKPRQCIGKQRNHFADKDTYSQNYGFSSSHVWMWELHHK